jgi:hypothetical protein
MTTFRQFVPVIVSLWLALCPRVKAATYEITCSDHWRDVLVGNRTEGYSVNTTGGCTVLATVPIETADITADPFSTNSHVELMLGGFDMYFYLRDDPNYKRGDTSVSFHENDTNTGGLLESIDLSWMNNVLTISATINFDAIDGESAYGTQGSAGVTEINSQIDFYFNLGNRVSFHEPNLNLIGKNTDYEITDPLGNPQSLEVGSVTATSVIRSPVPYIGRPALETVVPGTGSGNVVFAGTVEGISPLASVSYYLNGDTNNEIPIIANFANSVTSASWSTIIDLASNSDAAPGSNELSVIVYDIYGGWGSRGREVLWAFTNTLSLNVTGQGRIDGLHNQQLVNIGELYPVAAIPGQGWFLESWTDGEGNILSRRATFSYKAANGPVLNANFVTNPFAVVRGDYNGLFYDTNNGVSPGSAGAVAVTVESDGSYSGKFHIGEESYPLNGEFELASNYAGGALLATDENRVIRNGLPPFLFVLQLNVDTNLADPGAGALGGSLETFTDFSEAQSLWSSSFFAERSSYSSNNPPPGLYNIGLPPVDPTSASGPGGYSFVSAIVDKMGRVGFVLNLADGTTPVLSFASALASDGSASFYAPLYGGQGVMLGWFNLAITNQGSPWLAWLKLPASGKYYPNGFYINPPSFVSFYVPPRAGTNIFGGRNLELTFQGANLQSNVTIAVKFDAVKNTFSVPAPNSNKLALTFAPSSGLVTGTFLPPSSRASASFKALFIQGQSNAIGFFKATNETGSVILGAQ